MVIVTSDPEGLSTSLAPKVSFSHVHFYVDHLDDLQTYKVLEDRLNCIYQVNTSTTALPRSWHDPTPEVPVTPPMLFQPQRRDLVRQCLVGLGFRITGARYPSYDNENGTKASSTRSVLITSRDPDGVQFIVTAKAAEIENGTAAIGKDHYQHFDAGMF